MDEISEYEKAKDELLEGCVKLTQANTDAITGIYELLNILVTKVMRIEEKLGITTEEVSEETKEE